MSAVDTVIFDIMRGVPQVLKTEVDTWKVFGQDGIGAQLGGLTDGEFELETIVYCEDNATADSIISLCDALQGVIVSIEDDFVVTYENVLVKRVDTRNGKNPCIFQGNENAIRLSVKWSMETVSA